VEHKRKSIAWVLLREALRAQLRHRLRSTLTTLGITIGVAAVVLAVAIGTSGARRIQAEMEKLGENLVWVEAGSRNVAGVRTGTKGTTSLTPEDAEAISKEVPLIARVSPQIDGTVQVVGSTANWGTRFRGGSADYAVIRRCPVALGTNFSADDVDEAARKVLLGETVRRQLFHELNPVGETVRLQNQPYEVVGVLAPKGQSPDGRDQDDWVLLPWTTAQKRLRGGRLTWLDDIFCSAAAPDRVEEAIDSVIALMRQRHHIGVGQEDDFNIRRPDELLKAQAESTRSMTLLMVAIASIALLVGGIGIMNVMLASAVQRTREIGVRMAVGATSASIRVQFLLEAVGLSLIGAVLGLLTSIGAAQVMSASLELSLPIPPFAPLLAVAAAALVGVLSGVYPAWLASNLDPIEALRHE